MRKSAVRSANDEFYDKHPELVRNGTREPLDLCDPKQAALRSEWMRLYEKRGGKTRQVDSGSAPDEIFVKCPKAPPIDSDTADAPPPMPPATEPRPPVLTDAEMREKVKKALEGKSHAELDAIIKEKGQALKETYSSQGKVNPEDYYSAYYAHIKRHGLSEKEFPSWHVMRNLLQAGKVPETLSGAKALEKAGQASHEGIWGAYYHTKDSYRVKPGKPVVVPEPMASELRTYAKEHGMAEVPGFSTVDGKTVSDKIGFQASYDGSGNLLHGGDEVGTTDYIAPGSGDGHSLFDVDPHHRGNPNEYFSW